MRSPTHGTFRRNSPNVGTCVPRTSLPTNFSDAAASSSVVSSSKTNTTAKPTSASPWSKWSGSRWRPCAAPASSSTRERQPHDRGQEHEHARVTPRQADRVADDGADGERRRRIDDRRILRVGSPTKLPLDGRRASSYVASPLPWHFLLSTARVTRAPGGRSPPCSSHCGPPRAVPARRSSPPPARSSWRRDAHDADRPRRPPRRPRR